jgi:hypothetical protein
MVDILQYFFSKEILSNLTVYFVSTDSYFYELDKKMAIMTAEKNDCWFRWRDPI